MSDHKHHKYLWQYQRPFGSVRVANVVQMVYESRSWWQRLWCEHGDVTTYSRSDGPTYMDSTYEGVVCRKCGRILNETQVY